MVKWEKNLVGTKHRWEACVGWGPVLTSNMFEYLIGPGTRPGLGTLSGLECKRSKRE